MDEWEAERDSSDDASSSEARTHAHTGLMRATLVCSCVALGLAIFAAPAVKRQAQELAAKAQSGLDQMATGSIRRAGSAGQGSIGHDALSKSGKGTCNRGQVETGQPPC